MAKKQIALQDLFVGIHRAHRKGDVVPAENVEPNGWSDLVAAEGTKAANDAQKADQEEEQPATASAATSGGTASRSS